MKKVWFNADDFGLSDGVSRGIVAAMTRGVVGTTTALAGSDIVTAQLAEQAGAVPGRIGVHLQLTNGRPRLPPSEVPSLVDGDGRFPRKRSQLRNPDPREIAREWQAQVDCLGRLGIQPTHLDSHHHVHMLPAAIGVIADLARSRGLPARAGSPRLRSLLRSRGVACADHFSDRFVEPRCSVDGLLEVLEESGRTMSDGELLEVMCHPGRPDDRLAELSDYIEPRERELAVFLEPDLEDRIREIGFEVVEGPRR